MARISPAIPNLSAPEGFFNNPRATLQDVRSGGRQGLTFAEPPQQNRVMDLSGLRDRLNMLQGLFQGRGGFNPFFQPNLRGGGGGNPFFQPNFNRAFGAVGNTGSLTDFLGNLSLQRDQARRLQNQQQQLFGELDRGFDRSRRQLPSRPDFGTPPVREVPRREIRGDVPVRRPTQGEPVDLSPTTNTSTFGSLAPAPAFASRAFNPFFA